MSISSARNEYGDEARALLRLAAPVVLVQLGLMSMGVIDIIVVGHHSQQALAAVALGNVYQWGLLVFGQGVLMALDPLVSQAYGAGDRASMALHFRRGLVMAVLLSLPFFAAFQFAAPILRALGQPEETVPIAGAFVRASSLSLPAFFAFVVMKQTLQGMNIVRPVVVAVVVGNLCNLAGSYALVYGRFGLPMLGAPGAGYSTSVSRYLMAAVLALAVRGELFDGLRSRWRDVLRPEAFLYMLRIGLPIGLQVGLEVWAFLTVSLLMGRMGAVVLSGHQIALNLASVSFMVPLGIGAAAAVRVGNALGRKDPEGARRASVVALAVGASVMGLSALAFFSVPRLLARAYSPDPQVIAAAASLIPIAALFQIFDGTQAVGCGILRGSADTRVAAAINFIGYWLLALPLGMLLAYPLGYGPRGLWWGLTAGLATVATLLVLRVRRSFGPRPNGGVLEVVPFSDS